MRTKSLTTRAIAWYKATVTAVISVFVLLVVGYYLSQDRMIYGTMMLVPHLWYMHRIWRGLKLLKEISYDEHNLYVKEKDFEVQVPFYRIRSVDLISLDGVYKFTLRDADQFGETVFCKPSMWYPFTYKKVDEELYQLRKRIEETTRQHWEARQESATIGLSGMKI